MDTLKKLNYLFNKKTKLNFILLLFIIILGAGVELLGVSSILPVIELGLDMESVGESRYGQILYNMFGITNGSIVLIILIISVMAIYIVKNIYLYWMNNRICKFSMNTKRELATRLMISYTRQPYLYFLNKNTAEILRSLNSDVSQLYATIQSVLLAISSCITSIGLIAFLLTTNLLMVCLIIAVFAVTGVTVIRNLLKKLKKMGRENQIYEAQIYICASQTFEGIKEVKILNREQFFLDQYQEVYKKQSEIGRKQTLYNLIPKYVIETVSICTILAYMGANVWLNDNFSTMIPDLAIFAVAAFRLLPMMNQVYSYINGIMYNKASVDLIYHDIREVEKYEDWQEECEELFLKEKIEINNVTFSYPDATDPVLDNVSLVIPKGYSVALVGQSGGGKSTLVDIILGLLKPEAGDVVVDGISVCENIRGWQKNIGYIPQTIYLLDDTIRKNIAFGIDENKIDDNRVWEVLRQAKLEEFVKDLPARLETEVGEDGTRLSGGQRQRIGIARALYHNPGVLVFDEATSALDTDTEKEVMEAIYGLKGTKTMIMIAHRLSTIENCDYIYRVEERKVRKVENEDL